MKKTSYIFLLMLLAASCTSYPAAIEDVLRQAGNNRKELEKVLKHYSRNPADSLKLRAAEFLIVNMPGKYSEYYNAPWNDVATVMLRWTSSSDKQMVLDSYKLDKPVREDDVTHITAEYLINNIELAFKVWEEMPWGKQIPFDVFCEEILPHRVSTEPLENWREKALASFADPYKSFREDTTITTITACSRINDLLPRFSIDKDYPPMNYTQLMATARNTCDGMVALAIFAMRGLGIPVTYDFTPKWIVNPTGHSWNSVYNTATGKHISFMGTQSNPGQPHQGTTFVKAKVYRQVYGKIQNVNLNKADIPPLLHDVNQTIDATSEYDNCADVRVPLLNSHLNRTGYAFLAIYNGQEWCPIAVGETSSDSIQFLSVEKNILYLPVYYNNGIQSPASHHFVLNKDGDCLLLKPDSTQSELLTLQEIAPSANLCLVRMAYGRFEGANRSDFSDARLLHLIQGIPGAFYRSEDVHHASKFRYVRYVSPISGFCNVAELEFYDKSGNKLNGEIIGTSEVWNHSNMTRDKVFDGDVATFFDAQEADNAWVGLDLGEPVAIGKIRFLPRTDVHGIYEGHVYELFYWNGNEWHSLGRQTATSHVLQYEAPANAVFFLKSVTTNRIHRAPFIIEDKQQQWF